jgi:hypothetical protein
LGHQAQRAAFSGWVEVFLAAELMFDSGRVLFKRQRDLNRVIITCIYNNIGNKFSKIDGVDVFGPLTSNK